MLCAVKGLPLASLDHTLSARHVLVLVAVGVELADLVGGLADLSAEALVVLDDALRLLLLLLRRLEARRSARRRSRSGGHRRERSLRRLSGGRHG